VIADAAVGFEPTYKVLQTCPYPLGHAADAKRHPEESGRRAILLAIEKKLKLSCVGLIG
jgi:hypothetical protein